MEGAKKQGSRLPVARFDRGANSGHCPKGGIGSSEGGAVVRRQVRVHVILDMDPIRIDGTDRIPTVAFDFPSGQLSLSGESYPEDAAAFYVPLLDALRRYVSVCPKERSVVLTLAMVYFNSSSAKALMNIFQVLEATAAEGRSVTINWIFRTGDDTMQEFGEDFAEDFEHVKFLLHERERV